VSAQEALTARITEALDTHSGVLRPAIIALMAEAWEEGGKAAIEREHAYGAEEKAKFSNPYLPKVEPRPVRPPQEEPVWRGDREYLQAQHEKAWTPERYGGSKG